MPTWNELPTPKFRTIEVEACKWLEECGEKFLVDLATKAVVMAKPVGLGDNKRTDFKSLPILAMVLGWKPPNYMCPHCGKLFGHCTGLIPTHDYPVPCRAVCPGSQQTPRNPLSDMRPLWKDEKKDGNGTQADNGRSAEELGTNL